MNSLNKIIIKIFILIFIQSIFSFVNAQIEKNYDYKYKYKYTNIIKNSPNQEEVDLNIILKIKEQNIKIEIKEHSILREIDDKNNIKRKRALKLILKQIQKQKYDNDRYFGVPLLYDCTAESSYDYDILTGIIKDDYLIVNYYDTPENSIKKHYESDVDSIDKNEIWIVSTNDENYSNKNKKKLEKLVNGNKQYIVEVLFKFLTFFKDKKVKILLNSDNKIILENKSKNKLIFYRGPDTPRYITIDDFKLYESNNLTDTTIY